MSSYVLASEIGCTQKQIPYDYLMPGAAFIYPDSIVNSGKTTTPAAATHDVMQGFFAEQVAHLGWLDAHELFYRTLNTTTYPNTWLTKQFTKCYYTNINGELAHHNLGQIYLTNAFAMSFIKWSSTDFAIQPLNFNEANSVTASVFTNTITPKATGIKNMNQFIHPNNTKYDKLINNVFQQAYASPDFLGPCGKVIIYICNSLERLMPRWSAPNKTVTQKWWNMFKKINK